MDLANVLPTLTKKLLNLLAMSTPSSITMPLDLNFVHGILYLRLLITNFIICHDFLMLDLCSIKR